MLGEGVLRGDHLSAVLVGVERLGLIKRTSVCAKTGCIAAVRLGTYAVTVVVVASAVLVLAAGCGFEVADSVVGSQVMGGNCCRHDQAKVLVEVALRVHGFVGASV